MHGWFFPTCAVLASVYESDTIEEHAQPNAADKACLRATKICFERFQGFFCGSLACGYSLSFHTAIRKEDSRSDIWVSPWEPRTAVRMRSPSLSLMFCGWNKNHGGSKISEIRGLGVRSWVPTRGAGETGATERAKRQQCSAADERKKQEERNAELRV